jgi:hypothetical protein
MSHFRATSNNPVALKAIWVTMGSPILREKWYDNPKTKAIANNPGYSTGTK